MMKGDGEKTKERISKEKYWRREVSVMMVDLLCLAGGQGSIPAPISDFLLTFTGKHIMVYLVVLRAALKGGLANRVSLRYGR